MITQEIFNNNLERILPFKPKKVAVAVSGGSDSMALSLLTNNWAKNKNIECVGLTIDHRLRKESANEAKTVNQWLKKYSMPHEILTYTGEIPSSNIEAIAREYRYNMLIDYVKKNNIDFLLVAHNQDEQTETFFLNLSRGSGVYGLCGISEVYTRNGIEIIRPMLIFTKDEIKEYLKSQNQDWIEDPSNQDEKYKRVKIRKLKNTLENLDLSNERIINTMKNMNRVKTAIEFFVDEFINRYVIKQQEKILIYRQQIIYYPNEVVLRVFAKIIQEFSGGKYPPRLESLELLLNKIKTKTLKAGITLSNLKISENKIGDIIIEKEITRIKKQLEKSK